MGLDYCDSCQEIRDLKYCPETDSYHCAECQDETKKYFNELGQEIDNETQEAKEAENA